MTGDLLAHCIDTAMWLNGEISRVSARTETFIKERFHNLTGQVEPVGIPTGADGRVCGDVTLGVVADRLFEQDKPVRIQNEEFFGQLGLGTVNRDFPGIGNIDDSAMAGGIGFRWYPMPRFAIAVQTDVYVWDDNNDWESAVGSNQFSFQFIF